MERFKRILRKLLFPGAAVVLVSIPVAAVLLVYVLTGGREVSPIAYPVYAVAYSSRSS